jgi:hypothetical protein
MDKISGTIVLLVFMLVISTGCGKRTSEQGRTVSPDLVTNPITASGKNEKNDLPVMKFEQTKHDFGLVVQGEKVEWTFKFTNTGGADLIISNASSTCGCTVANYSKEPVKPGGTGSVSVVFNSAGRSGIQTKGVNLLTNAQPNNIELEVTASIYVPSGK